MNTKKVSHFKTTTENEYKKSKQCKLEEHYVISLPQSNSFFKSLM